MASCVHFGEKDKELLQKIWDFQKEKRLPSFAEAVRILCKDALAFKQLTK